MDVNKDKIFQDYPDVVTIVDLQKMLGVGRNVAYSLVTNNQIKHFKIGKSIKIPKVFVIDFINNNATV